FARPAGSWLLGIYADRSGRRSALVLATIAMGAASLVIAVTPSYARIGIAAPGTLLLCRIVQGLSVGGEYAASATYLTEVAGSKRRGLWSSFQYATLILGQLVALALLLILQRFLSVSQMTVWGWRIPFMLGAVFALLAMLMMLGMEETESF